MTQILIDQPLPDMPEPPTAPLGWEVPDVSSLPRLPELTACCRVLVGDVSDYREMIALGHVGKLRAVAAFARYARREWDTELLWADDDGKSVLDEALGRVEHRWVVQVNDDGGFSWLEPATPMTRGAIPVTWWTVPAADCL